MIKAISTTKIACLLFISFFFNRIIISSATIGKADGVMELSFENKKVKKCFNYLNELDKNKLILLSSQYSTSSVLSSNETKKFVAKPTGLYGQYNLLILNKSGIRELGKLVIYTKKKASDWKAFGKEEKLISITLKDSAFHVNSYLFVGQNLEVVKNYINGIKKINNYNFTFKDSCEIIEIKTDTANIIIELKITKITS